MAHKSKTQPLCRYCGGAIKKMTDVLYCYAEPPRAESEPDDRTGVVHKFAVPRHRVGFFRTKEDLQKVCNEQVVSVRYFEDFTEEFHQHGRHIWQASTWDGASYRDEFFCSGEHARDFAYLFAKAGYSTSAYDKATADAKAEMGE